MFDLFELCECFQSIRTAEIFYFSEQSAMLEIAEGVT